MAQQAVIFDLDGTLVHSSPDIAHHLNVALGKVYGDVAALSERDVEMLIGGGMLDLISKGVEALDLAPTPEEAAEVLRIYREGYLAEPVVSTAVYDGVPAMLDDLERGGYALGLCTNKSEATAHRVLDYFGMTHRFGAIIGGDTAAARKPDAAPLIEACACLDVALDHAVMVGDSKADFGAARNAGTKIALVDWGYSAVDVGSLGGDVVISDYAGFDATVARLLAQ